MHWCFFRLVPVLLSGMKYSDTDMMTLKVIESFQLVALRFNHLILQGDLEDDANVPDRESSIKPRHHHSKTHSQQHENEVTI